MSELVPLLNVENVKRSIDFYRAVLGAEVENQWESDGKVRWARVSFDGGRLMLNTPGQAVRSDRADGPEFADIVLYVMCDDAPERRERLLAAGMDVGELRAEEYGNDEFAVRDPDGYALRFSSPRA
ncbi:MAG: VOC family protein [Myxococcota bacterium]